MLDVNCAWRGIECEGSRLITGDFEQERGGARHLIAALPTAQHGGGRRADEGSACQSGVNVRVDARRSAVKTVNHPALHSEARALKALCVHNARAGANDGR